MAGRNLLTKLIEKVTELIIVWPERETGSTITLTGKVIGLTPVWTEETTG